MRNAAHSAGLPLDDFAKLVRDNSTTLAALYGSTNQGAMGIAGLAEALRTEATPELAGLGFTVDEINETLLTNLDRQRRQGIFDRLSVGERTKSAKDYAMELDRLAKLTGQQRSELRKQLEAQASNARFAAFIRTQDDETGRRLSSFAATVSGVAPLVSEGLEDIIANAGRPVTDAGLQLIQNIPELQGTIQNLIAGTISSEQALMSMKDMSTKSLDRFSKAAVTGTVPFLDLTPGIVSLSTLTLDHVAAMKEQMSATAGGTSSLMQFQENAKRLSAATQSLETGFYSMLGALGGDETNNVVGAIGKMSDNFIKGTSDFTKAMLYGSKTLVGMGINLLRNTLPTYTAVYKGTLHGNLKAGGSGGGFLGGLGKKGKVGKLVKGGARVAGGLGRALPAIGAVTTTGMSIAGLLDDDKSNDVSSWTGLAGSVIGGLLGAFGGPAGAMIGMTLGNMAGSAVGGMFSGKQHGGPMTGGNPHLVGETGPEIVMTKANSNVLSNAESNRMFNTKNLETQLTALVAGQASANKFASQHLDSVNRGNMIAHKTSLDVAKSARQDKNAVGMI